MPDLKNRLTPGFALAGLSALLYLEVASPGHTAARENWAAFVLPSMERIGLQDSPRVQTNVSLRAARGEYAAFQIVLAAGKSALTGVTFEVSDLSKQGGGTIPNRNLTLFRERYVHVSSPSPDPGWGNRPLGKGWYPDALIPLSGPGDPHSRTTLSGSQIEVPAETNQPIWVDIQVPREAAPGDYSGVIGVAAGPQLSKIRVALHIWNFVLPLKPTLQSSFGMHEPSLSDRRVHELLLEHGLMPESVNPADAAHLAAEFGLNTTGLRFWSNFNKTDCSMDQAPRPDQIAAAMKLYPQDLDFHIYSADEIDSCPQVFDRVRQWAAAMHTASGRIQNLVTVAPVAALFSDGTGTSRSGVDIWALLPKMWDSDSAGIAAARARGGKIWAYTALVQEPYSPKWEIDFAPINYRILPGFLAQSMELSGILYWRVDLWTAAPFDDLRGYTIAGNYYPGEGMLLYPGDSAGTGFPLASMRLKWIREGEQDFEYVAILKRMGRATWALQCAAKAGTDWRHWTRDTQVLVSVHDELGNEIERLTNLSIPDSHTARTDRL